MTVRVCGSAWLYLGPNERSVGSNLTQTPGHLNDDALFCSSRLTSQTWVAARDRNGRSDFFQIILSPQMGRPFIFSLSPFSLCFLSGQTL